MCAWKGGGEAAVLPALSIASSVAIYAKTTVHCSPGFFMIKVIICACVCVCVCGGGGGLKDKIKIQIGNFLV